MDSYGKIAEYYDLEHDGFRDDIDFYLNLLEAGSVLEIGSGTGRVMKGLLDAGWEVWGVEPSEQMLERARRRLAGQARVELIQASVLDLGLDRRFSAVLLSLNMLWHLTSLDEQVKALEVTRRHLEANGVLCVDLSNPLSMADRGGNGELRVRFRHESPHKTVVGLSAAWDDQAEQLIRLQLVYEETDGNGRTARTLTELQLRYVFRSELDLMLRLAGFRVAQMYGSYDLDAYDAVSPCLIAVATPVL